uniref:TNFR-Cys domain-containing protein n=1 Tax=Sphenodon punctatus TaxID=8508 RepID=A0A8D0GS74_SPHPU
MECREMEYMDERRKCIPCRECGPGWELSKECGYGEGGDAECIACHPRRFKDSWGRHGCKPCLSCTLINRVQKSNCTATSDAACGDCLPGFYSKTRIGGLQDLECIPCTKQTPTSESQCSSRVSLVKVETPTAPPQDTTLVALTSSALVIIVLVLLTVSIIYCRRFWKSQCQRVFLRTQDFSDRRVTFQASVIPARFSCQEQLSSPCCLGVRSPRQVEGPAKAVQFISDGEVAGFQLPYQQPDSELPEVIAMSPSPQAQLARSIFETQPLIRNSGCSDCSAGGSSTSEARQRSAGVTEVLAPLPSCATEMQHRWPHAPVECTELDLQKFSTQTEFIGTENQEDEGNWAAQRGSGDRPQLTPEGPRCCIHTITQSGQSSFSSFRTPTAESGEPFPHSALLPSLGLPVVQLLHNLVRFFDFWLDPSSPRLKIFRHVGMELGVPSQMVKRTSGFEQLVTHLALQWRWLFDTLLVLCDHFPPSQVQGFRC